MTFPANVLQSRLLCSLICTAAILLPASGCQLSDFDSAVRPMLGTAPKPVEEEAPAPVSTLITLGYCTSSSRINAAALAAGKPAMPPAKDCWLQIRYPHPGGLAGKAQAVLLTQPLLDEATILNQTASSALANPIPAIRDGAAKQIDIDGADAATLLSELRNRRFFQRTEVSTPTAYIAVAVDGNDFGRGFKSQPALDEIVLKCWHEGAAYPSSAEKPASTSPQQRGSEQGQDTTAPTAALMNLRRLPPVQ